MTVCFYNTIDIIHGTHHNKNKAKRIMDEIIAEQEARQLIVVHGIVGRANIFFGLTFDLENFLNSEIHL